MAFYLSPLVDVNEIDLSTTIPAVATSIGVIALRNTYKGPEKKQHFVSDESDLIRGFGEPTDSSYEDLLSAAGFLKYGNKLYATRVMPDDATFAGITIDEVGAADGFLSISDGKDATFTFTDIGVDGIVNDGEIVVTDKGTGYRIGDILELSDGISGSGATVRVSTIDTAGGVLTIDPVITGGSGYVDSVLTTTVVDGYDVGFPTQTMDDLPSEDPDDFGLDVTVDAGGDRIWVIANSRGAWGDNIRVSFLNKNIQDQIVDGTLDPSTFTDSYLKFLEIDSRLGDDPVEGLKDVLVVVEVKDQRKSTYTIKETFNVSTNPNALDDTGSTRFIETIINQQSDYIRVAISATQLNTAWSDELSKDMYYDLVGGSDGDVIITPADITKTYELYENPEDIDVNILIDSGKDDQVKSDLIDICAKRMDCMAVLDCPKVHVLNNKGTEATDLRFWRNNTFNKNTSYAAVYGNWIEVYDKYNQKYRWIPTSGYVAGIYAKTDDVADAWWAPAGLNRAILTGVRRLAWNPKLGHRDILYSNGINPIVSFSGEGKVIWGQKTMLSKSSAFDRVNVRRLFMVLEKAISTASKYFLFEPNDPATRTQIYNMIEPFLRDVKARRGIYDFKIVVDETVNTPVRIDRNELWVNIFIKPTRAAEFIVLNFVATSTGASFEEAAQAVQ